MAIDNLPIITSDESRLSDAYIRTLVKQLTSSTKPTNNHQNLITNNGRIVGDYTQSIVPNNKGENFGMAKQKNQNAQGHKKQVRRRLHTSRPYQERLLNMAEARKEIVTALKFHRAAMKKASEKNQQQLDYQTPQEQQSILRNCEIVQPKIESLPFTNTNPMVGNFSHHPSSYDCNSYPWLISSLPLIDPSPNETLNIPLPNQTLGLNLNLQAFANLDTTFFHSINTPSSNLKYNSAPTMSPSSSSSSSTPRDLVEAISSQGVGPIELMNGGIDMHCALDEEEEMAKIRSIGEQHQIEWDDTLDLAKSAWWFKFLKSVEFGKEIKEGLESNKHNGYSFEEFPPWLSANEQSFLQQHFEESCSEGTSLPWVDIGDIDGMDEDWLS